MRGYISIFFDKAARFFELHGFAKPELARCTFKIVGFIESIGDRTHVAMQLYSVRRRGNSIGIGSGGDPGRLLAAEDFDKVVSPLRI